MPAIMFECCDDVHTADELLAHVARRDNHCQWTYELLAAMLAAQASHPSATDASRISTTVLTNKCLRRIAFERTSTFIVKPEDLYALFRGTQFHGRLEAYAAPGTYTEARFHVRDLGTKIPAIAEALPNDDRSFSGSPDFVDAAHGIVGDYKRVKEVPRFSYPWPDHVAQLNVNRWLVDHADTVELVDDCAAASGAPGAIRIGGGRVTWDMSRPTVRSRFVPVDWQALVVVYVDDRGPKPLTCTESIDVPTKAGGKRKARVPEIWSDERVERYIAERYVEARRAFSAGIAPIPDGWEFQSHVLCGYCPMRRKCAEHERNGQ